MHGSRHIAPIAYLPRAVPLLVGLAIGALAGMINGLLIAYVGIPRFIAMLGMMGSATGCAAGHPWSLAVRDGGDDAWIGCGDGSLFSYVDLEERVPAKHPLRVIREVVNEVLVALDAEFSAMYSDLGRAPIP